MTEKKENKLIKKILLAEKKYSLFADKTKLLIALSGGADSCALFYALFALKEQFSLSFSAVHVNHQIRGEEAFRDETFVTELCKKEQVPLFLERVDIPSIAASKKISVELAAREERYRIFERLSKEHDFNAVATAHNANDNAETILFHLTRGSSLDGLCGIPPKRGNLIRPLILATRQEIEEYLTDQNKGYLNDSTNANTEYTRNFIRHIVLPELKKINPSLEQTLTRTAMSLSYDKEYLDAQAEEHLTSDIKKLALLPNAILTRVIIKLFEEDCGGKLETVHIEAVVNEIKRASDSFGVFHKEISMPGNAAALITEKLLLFQKNGERERIAEPFDIILNYGENKIQGTDFMIYCSQEPLTEELLNIQRIYKLFNKIILFSDKIKGTISVRNRNSGDGYQAFGIHRSVKKMLIDKKIPQNERDRLPVLYDSGGVIWLPHCPVCDRLSAKQEDQGKRIYLFIFQKQENCYTATRSDTLINEEQY